MNVASPDRRQIGKVKFFDKERGFGFVTFENPSHAEQFLLIKDHEIGEPQHSLLPKLT